MKFNVEQDVRNRYNKVPSEGDDRKTKTKRYILQLSLPLISNKERQTRFGKKEGKN